MAEATDANTMPAFIRVGMDFFTGKTVLKTSYDEKVSALDIANARIKELEASVVDPAPLNERISTLEGEAATKDASIKAKDLEITELRAQYESASKQAQQQLAKIGAAPPVATDAPKNPAGEKTFVQLVGDKVAAGMKKADAVIACVREFPQAHQEAIAKRQINTL